MKIDLHQAPGELWRPAELDTQFSARWHRPKRIQRKIQKHLLQPVSVSICRDRSDVVLDLDLLPSLPRQWQQKLHSFADQSVQFGWQHLCPRVTVELQNV